MDFEEDLVVDEPDENPGVARRVSWMDHAETLYDAPLQMVYTGLDPKARYKVRVLYAGDSPKRKIRLVANDAIEVHPLSGQADAVQAAGVSDCPQQRPRQGKLTLSWFGEPGLGGNGRGVPGLRGLADERCTAASQ